LSKYDIKKDYLKYRTCIKAFEANNVDHKTAVMVKLLNCLIDCLIKT